MRVLITGASRGLGRGLAEEHLARGDEVWSLGRSEAPQLGAAGFHYRQIDLARLDEARFELDDLLASAGPIDLVWLNAGRLGAIADLAESDLDEMKATLDLNLWANKVVLDAVFAAGPPPARVVAISSGAAVRGHRGWGGYALSKAALNMLMQLEAAEHPETRFHAIAPGLVDTAMQETISSLPSDPRFASLERLKAARGTENMPHAREAARRLLEVLPALDGLESGSFADIREIGSRPS